MRRVAIGILAVVLSAGCALEAGDPGGEGTSSRPGEVTTASGGEQLQSARAPMIRGTSPTGASSATPLYNPEPSPWVPPALDPAQADDGTNLNPEPAPWHPSDNTVQGGSGQSGSQSGGGSTKSSGSAPAHPSRIGHWDLKDTTSN